MSTGNHGMDGGQPTTSFAILMSTQSELNSHTSKNSMSAASASADASSGDVMLKRKTMSSPYRATRSRPGVPLADGVSAPKLF